MKAENKRIIEEYTKCMPDVLYDEEWKETSYSKRRMIVSNYGRIAKYYPYYKRWKLVRACISLGYYRCNGIDNGKHILLHRIVANLFLPKVDGKEFINHKNGNKLDNRIDNLEWCTLNENNQHAIKYGLFDTKGEKHWNSKLNDDLVRKIKMDIKSGILSIRKIAKKHGVKSGVVNNIIYKKGWSHIEI